MSRVPFLKLFFSDLAGDTLHLSTEEFGAYVLALGAMWNNGGYLPADDGRLARIARVSPKRWPRVWAAIGDFFDRTGDQITNARLLAEREKADQISQERRNSGKRGVEAKRLKTQGSGEANGSANGKQPKPEYSVPTEQAQSAPPDPNKEAWRRGAGLLMAQGRLSEAKARQFFGKLLKDHPGLEARDLLPSIVKAETGGTQVPQPYLIAAAKKVADRRADNPSPRVTTWSEGTWTAALANFAADPERWSEPMGPRPGEPGCLAPAAILAQHSFVADVIPIRSALRD